MKIRAVLPTDEAEWLRLRSALWPDAPRDDLARELDAMLASEAVATFVCERDGGGLAGFVEASLRAYAEGCDTSPVGFVEGWYVDPDERRRGVGRALVAAAETWAIARGCREMASDSLLENDAAHAAHRALGYEEVERAVRFRKDLPAEAPPERRSPTVAHTRNVRLSTPPRYVAVVGPGDDAPPGATRDAEAVGCLLAERGWITLSGGRAAGVMAAAALGATHAGGLAVGLLPSDTRADAAPALAVALPTGLREARNAVLVAAADAVVGCGLNPGTASELALALRAGKPTVLVRASEETVRFFRMLASRGSFHAAGTPAEAVEWLAGELARA